MNLRWRMISGFCLMGMGTCILEMRDWLVGDPRLVTLFHMSLTLHRGDDDLNNKLMTNINYKTIINYTLLDGAVCLINGISNVNTDPLPSTLSALIFP